MKPDKEKLKIVFKTADITMWSEYLIWKNYKMAKSLFEQLGGTYRKESDYLIPCLTVPAEEEQPIGIWGQRHLNYLKQHQKVTYTNLLTSGKLNTYLADINRQAQERFERLIEDMKQAQGITEQLKAENVLEWTGHLNNIRNSYTHKL